MLEVMVAILVLSLGLLGVAGLQTATAKYRVNTQANASVAQLVGALTEKIRANPNAAGQGYDSTNVQVISKYLLNDSYATQTTSAISDAAVDCGSATCTADQKADYDMVEWKRLLKISLPQGAGWVEGGRLAGFNIWVMWMDKEQADSPSSGSTRSLIKAPVCGTTTVDTIFNCCPSGANVPAGVRCTRFSLVP